MDETLRTLLGIGSAAFVAKRAVFPTGTEKQVKMKVVCSVHVCVCVGGEGVDGVEGGCMFVCAKIHTHVWKVWKYCVLLFIWLCLTLSW